jgi:SAM-dependent methyltransferase
MRKGESEYWDGIAEITISRQRDNIWKRREIVKKLLDIDFINKRVLEIGVGLPFAASSLYFAHNGAFKYKATDVSPKFVEFANSRGFDTVCTDVTNLPDGPFDIVFALDSLEHVNPEDRGKGYREIERVLAPHAKIILNIPVEETKHDLKYDHEFDINDVLSLALHTKTSLTKWELYRVTGKHPNGNEINIRYIWSELER